jgi:transcriptional regulator with XRE-family HTH domain
MDISPREIARQLQEFLAKTGLTQEALQKRTGIAQSQISRVMRGRFHRITPNVRKLCAAAKIKTVPLSTARDESEIAKLVRLIVGGSRHRERLLAKLLKTGMLLLSDVSNVHRKRH